MDLKYAEKTQRCKTCGTCTRHRFAKYLNSNGVEQLFWRCEICRPTSAPKGIWTSHKELDQFGVTMADIPLGGSAADMPRCYICGVEGAELHHFAPRKYFPRTCEQWPKVFLCCTHHMIWHDLVTPGLVTHGQPPFTDEFGLF